MEKMRDSLKKLAALEGDYEVFPGHDRSTRLSFEREHNTYMRMSL
jgi:glyoxylase-like metal-dependent hydrolase (beta-lactamase superfamily II)